VESEVKSDLPEHSPIDYQAFQKYKSSWLYWRALGHVDSNGSFVAPVLLEDAKRMPKDEIDFYFDMDSLLSRMQRNHAKKKGNQ
jgi:hypothetical protein